MKKHEIIFSTIKLPLDFIIVLGSFFAALKVRSMTDLIPGIQLPLQNIETQGLLGLAVVGASMYILVFASHWLYNSKLTSSKIQECIDIIRYGIYWFWFYALFLFLWKWYIYDSIDIPRLVILFNALFAMSLSIISRIILNNLQYACMNRGLISKRRIILINNKSLKDIQHIIDDLKKAQIYDIIWYINKQDLNIDGLQYRGTKKDFLQLCKTKKVDEVLSIESDFSKKDLYKIWDISRIFGIQYRYLTNGFDITKTNTQLSLIHNIPTLEIKTTSLGMWWRVSKRGLDICISWVALILLSPLLIIVYIIIKMGNPQAPAIYKNTRVGQEEKPFTLYKFRYMKWEHCVKENYGVLPNQDPALKTESSLIKKQSLRHGPLYKIENDPRKTFFGSYIERYSIDELPQLFNVLLGSMSLIGPRPHQPREVKKYSLFQKRVLTIKPGITGMAQVNGREKNTFDDEAKLDIFYIENWSILLDMKIFFKTFPLLFNRK